MHADCNRFLGAECVGGDIIFEGDPSQEPIPLELSGGLSNLWFARPSPMKQQQGCQGDWGICVFRFVDLVSYIRNRKCECISVLPIAF